MAATNTLSEAVYPVTGKEISEIIPGIGIGFRVCGSVTLAYVWINKKLRIGVANCSIKDGYDQVFGEKRALKLAFAQHDMTYPLRAVLWEQYLISRGITKEPVSLVYLIQSLRDTRQCR